MKAAFQRTMIFVGLAVVSGLFAAFAAETAEAQCGRGSRCDATPYQPPGYTDRARVPPSGRYPYYGSSIYARQYAAPPATGQPAPSGRGMAPNGGHGHDRSKHQPSAVPGYLPAAATRMHRMAPAERDSHAPAEAPPDIHSYPLASVKTEAAAPPDLPLPAPRDTFPRDTFPRDTFPRDTSPRDIAPRDIAPRDTTSIGAAPSALQTLAEKQRTCPVTGERLGLMGEPYKVHFQGRDVMLCCNGCEAKFKSDPDKYLAKLNP